MGLESRFDPTAIVPIRTNFSRFVTPYASSMHSYFKYARVIWHLRRVTCKNTLERTRYSLLKFIGRSLRCLMDRMYVCSWILRRLNMNAFEDIYWMIFLRRIIHRQVRKNRITIVLLEPRNDGSNLWRSCDFVDDLFISVDFFPITVPFRYFDIDYIYI